MGSNMAENHPVGFQWVAEAKKRGAKIIHVDPRFTRTSAFADTFVPLRAGSDIAPLTDLERDGWKVAPSAKAVDLTMNRDGIRDFAANQLGLVTSHYRFAESREEAVDAVAQVGIPGVVKPVMSSSGKGQTTVKKAEEVEAAWEYAVANMRGDRPRVIVEEFI